METDELMLNLLTELVEGRNAFLARGMNRITPQNRDALASRFFINELCYLELSNRIFQNHIRNSNAANAAATLLSLNIPANFMEPVTVRPTAEQITNGTETVEDILPGTMCAVCQESVTENALKIVHCNHTYHRNCLESWFTMSPRCPVCRHDIREGPAN